MRINSRLAAVLTVGAFVVLHSSNGAAQSFYTGSGSNMFRVFGCPAHATLNLNGTGPSQQGDCTIYQTGSVIPAVPIEIWVSAQLNGGVSGLQAQNEKLQKEIDDLTARVQALEAVVNQSPRTIAPRKPGP
jgi:hypothetical protein